MGRGSQRGERYARGDEAPRDDDVRTHIAQVAAMFIVEHGIGDWTLAKRKAARQLVGDERAPLPNDAEVEAAIAEHQELYGGDAQKASLRAQREEALVWMKRLAEFRPVLVGAVAAGWASEHSDIRLELVADDEKVVELVLINANQPYRVPPQRADGAGEIHIDTPKGGLRLIVQTDALQRQRRKKDRQGNDAVRLDAAALAALLDGAAAAP